MDLEAHVTARCVPQRAGHGDAQYMAIKNCDQSGLLFEPLAAALSAEVLTFRQVDLRESATRDVVLDDVGAVATRFGDHPVAIAAGSFLRTVSPGVNIVSHCPNTVTHGVALSCLLLRF
jgi:hypothetical protein